MKIEGISGNLARTEEVKLDSTAEGVEVITLTVAALPWSHHQTINKRLPLPLAPETQNPAKDEKGGILRDVRGVPILALNTRDPKFMEDTEEVQSLHSYALIHQALRADKRISFESDKVDCEDTAAGWVAYYTSLRDEIDHFGFSFGDIRSILKTVNTISGITPEEVAEAKKDFTATGTPGESKEE